MQVRSKYWLALIGAILFALAASDVLAAGSIEEELATSFEDKGRGHTMCASFNALVAVKQSGFAQKIIQQEAYRHYQLAVAELGNATAADATEAVMMHIQENYNAGAYSWADLVDISEACTNF